MSLHPEMEVKIWTNFPDNQHPIVMEILYFSLNQRGGSTNISIHPDLLVWLDEKHTHDNEFTVEKQIEIYRYT